MVWKSYWRDQCGTVTHRSEQMLAPYSQADFWVVVELVLLKGNVKEGWINVSFSSEWQKLQIITASRRDSFFHITINLGLDKPWTAYVFPITCPCPFYLLALPVGFGLMIASWMLNLQISHHHSQEAGGKIVKDQDSKRQLVPFMKFFLISSPVHTDW